MVRGSNSGHGHTSKKTNQQPTTTTVLQVNGVEGITVILVIITLCTDCNVRTVVLPFRFFLLDAKLFRKMRWLDTRVLLVVDSKSSLGRRTTVPVVRTTSIALDTSTVLVQQTEYHISIIRVLGTV